MQILSPLRVKVDAKEQIFRTLLDKHCSTIMSITKENAMTASMICSCCDISPSTVYRKLKLLQKLNLLRVTYIIQHNGKKSMSFQSKTIRVSILMYGNQLLIDMNFVPLK
ncbi:MAG: helix-turn-helix domain-containing protein [Nitrosotalea sp.]